MCVTETCAVQPASLLSRNATTLTGRNATSAAGVHSEQQCQWFEAPVTRSSRQLYQPVYLLARHWVLSGRQFDLSHIADVLVDNATALLVSILSGI